MFLGNAFVLSKETAERLLSISNDPSFRSSRRFETQCASLIRKGVKSIKYPSFVISIIGKPNKTDLANASLTERCSRGFSEVDR